MILLLDQCIIFSDSIKLSENSKLNAAKFCVSSETRKENQFNSIQFSFIFGLSDCKSTTLQSFIGIYLEEGRTKKKRNY